MFAVCRPGGRESTWGGFFLWSSQAAAQRNPGSHGGEQADGRNGERGRRGHGNRQHGERREVEDAPDAG